MNFSNTTSSSLFGYSLAQYVIIDNGIPTPAHITENILSAIQNVVCLGPTRIPAVGVALVNSTFQSVVTLSPTDTQLHRIVHALKSVMDSGKCRARISMEEFNDNIHIGIKKALEDYDNLLCKMNENGQASIAGLQIMIFSMKNGFEIKMKLEQSFNLLSTKKVKKIQMIELTEEYMRPEPNRNYGGISRFVEYIRIPGSLSRLDELLKQWLVLRESDQEHVQIILQDSVILCDIRECVVLPTTMLQASHQSEVRTLAVEVLQLEVTHRLSSDGLSETEMFGDPIALVPSQCRQLDGADKGRNQQYFIALSEKLMTANEYLVAKSEMNNQLVKYFVLLPGEGMLLLKTLTTSEIAMPSTDIHNQFVTQEVDCCVSESLLALPCLDSYTPTEFPTGLYRHLVQSALTENLKRNRPPPPVYHDPSHESVVVGIEIKKTTKRRKTLSGKSKKSAFYDLPQLTSSDQQTLDEFLASKQGQKNKTCQMFRR